jgi:GTP-binding protein HflX
LEEAKYADIILHVVDSANPDVDNQMHIVYDTLNKLGIQDKIIITALNKQDKEGADQVIKDFKADYTVKISARTGSEINTLLEVIEKILNERKILIERVFSYQDAGKIQTIR